MRILLAISALLFSICGIGQTTIKWSELGRVEFVEFFDRNTNDWSLEGKFSEGVQELNGQDVIITGYIIPLDVTGNTYALSAFAFSSCFFCGGAGPETVMGLQFREDPPRFKTDDVVKLRGTLTLNTRPGGGFHYLLTQVEVIQQY